MILTETLNTVCVSVDICSNMFRNSVVDKPVTRMKQGNDEDDRKE